LLKLFVPPLDFGTMWSTCAELGECQLRARKRPVTSDFSRPPFIALFAFSIAVRRDCENWGAVTRSAP